MIEVSYALPLCHPINPGPNLPELKWHWIFCISVHSILPDLVMTCLHYFWSFPCEKPSSFFLVTPAITSPSLAMSCFFSLVDILSSSPEAAMAKSISSNPTLSSSSSCASLDWSLHCDQLELHARKYHHSDFSSWFQTLHDS